MTENKKQNQSKGVKRRKFLKYTGAGLGLMLGGIWLARNPLRRAMLEMGETTILPYQGDTNPLLWLEVRPDSSIVLHSSKVEMGQGTFTGLAQLAAEELEIPMERIRVQHATTQSGNIDGMSTGGSMSIAALWTPLRELAATMRVMLMAKAAEKLSLPPDQVTLKNGVFAAGGKSLTFGEVVEGVTDWDIPKAPPLKPRASFRHIGHPIRRVDLREKVTGAPIFGMDATYSDMLYASVLRPTHIDAEITNVDTGEAEQMPGVVQVVREADFVAVVAESQVEADNARLKIKFDHQPNRNWNLEDVLKAVTVGNGKKTVFQKEGKAVEDISGEGEIIEMEFRSPIGAHAQIEPNGAVASYQDGRVEVKISTQVPKITRAEVAKALGIDQKDVNIIPTYLGGGFGRRLHTPHAVEAALLSKAVGRPVKSFFDRIQEFQNDTFRPPSHHIMKAKLSPEGKVLGLEHQFASGDTFFNSALDPGISATVLRADFGSVRGGALIYDALPHRSTYYHVDLPFATSFWRSLGLLANAFAIESFMDELALKTNQNPVSFRLDSISDENPYGVRAKKVIEACAERAGYRDTVLNGRAMGFAACIDGGSPCAQVAEVSIEDDKIKVHKVTAAFDCGIAVNPDLVKAQVEGCICMGISASMFEKMDLKDNKLSPVIYGAYDMALMKDSPKEIDVILLEGVDYPGPVGEPPLGPIGPAIGNAVRRLTGKRLTELPLDLNQKNTADPA
ncbi:MAG: molybdopterin-dependent oxidoreductase [Saprospiraceae bacterium]|nr:molybdopterin-dependent oxidoreductase [Saprospiraceae bacterium]